jgi:hypothetical protein
MAKKSDFTVNIDTSVGDQLVAGMPQRIDAGMRAICEEMVSDIKLNFGTSPPGRSYQHGSVTHIASQPGYPPNVDVGNLRAGIWFGKIGPLTYVVADSTGGEGEDWGYGQILEVGGRHLAPRPFMRPVFLEYQGGKAAEIMKDFIL